MTTFETLVLGSLKMFLRNRQAVFFTFFMPLVFMAVFGLIGRNRVQKVDLGLVAVAPDASVRNFIDAIKQVPTFNVTEGTEADEREQLDKGERVVVLVVPDSLEPVGPVRPTIRVLINAGQAPQAGSVISILQQMIDQQTLAAAHLESPVTLQPETINARNLKYIDFLLPGLLAMAIMQMSIFSVAFVFAEWREKGVLKRLVATPLRPFEFVGANVITRLAVSLAQALVLISVGVLVFNASVIGSYPLVILLTILGTLMFLGIGFTISSFAKTVETVPAIANLIVLPMLFLGGVFFPIDNFPTWLQHLAKILPITPFSTALRSVMLDGAGVGAIAKDIGLIAGWVVVFLALATYTFRFQEKNN